MPGADDLLGRLRALAEGAQPVAAAEGLPTGFAHVDDVIVLLQPLPLAAVGVPPETAPALASILQQLQEKNFLTGSQAVGHGGLAAALVDGCIPSRRGFHVELTENEGADVVEALFAPRDGCALVSTRPKAHVPLANFVERRGDFTAEAVGRVTDADVRVRWMGATMAEGKLRERGVRE